jgi:hypothetical protein
VVFVVDSFLSDPHERRRACDEDGGVVFQTTTYVFLVSAKKEWFALRTDNSLLGLARLSPLQ